MTKRKTTAAATGAAPQPAHFAKRHAVREADKSKVTVYPAGYQGEIPGHHHAHAAAAGKLQDPQPETPPAS